MIIALSIEPLTRSRGCQWLGVLDPDDPIHDALGFPGPRIGQRRRAAASILVAIFPCEPPRYGPPVLFEVFRQLLLAHHLYLTLTFVYNLEKPSLELITAALVDLAPPAVVGGTADPAQGNRALD